MSMLDSATVLRSSIFSVVKRSRRETHKKRVKASNEKSARELKEREKKNEESA